MTPYKVKNGNREHRVVWEQHHGPVPKGYHVHHIDKDKRNNDISNLQLLSAADHQSLHHKGRPSAMLGKTHSDEARAKIGAYWRNRKQSPEHVANRIAARKARPDGYGNGFEKLSPEERSELGKRAAFARWRGGSNAII